MIKYCPRCHLEVYRIVEDGDTIKVMQGRKTLINVGRSSSITMSLSCPLGHSVKVKIGESKTEHPPETGPDDVLPFD